MKAIKVYGIIGLLEWHGTIESHGLKMKLDFTNGSTTAFGVAPATFTTKDELTQRIIENSEKFKNGRIKLIRTIPLPEEKPAKIENEEQKKAAVTPSAANNTPLPEEPTGADNSENESESEEVPSGVIKVADKTEAIEWLKEHYPDKGYTKTNLKGKAFDDACTECGVVFEFC